jgi:hypothetical protein
MADERYYSDGSLPQGPRGTALRAGGPAVVLGPYTMAAGQRYSVVGGIVPTDCYYAPALNTPADYTVVRGTNEYLRIQFNGREAFVRKADAVLAN